MFTHMLTLSIVPDGYIGIVSSSMFAGMMFGAVGWGTCKDILKIYAMHPSLNVHRWK